MSGTGRSLPRIAITSHVTSLAVVGTSVIFAICAAAVLGGPETLWIVACIASVVITLTAAAMTAREARGSLGRRRWLWTSMTVGLLGWGAGSAVAAGAGNEAVGVPNLAPVLGAVVAVTLGVTLAHILVLRDNNRLVAALADQALRDPLTGVGNRALFSDRLTHALELRQRDRGPLTVLALDLHDFKFVNVSLGHPAGDWLLTAVAERLLSCLRTGDTLARMGGDEFAVLMEGELDSARAVAHRVELSFDQPFVLDGRDVIIQPSIGVAAISTQDADVRAGVLLARAEAAMHAAQADGGGGLRLYTSELHDRFVAASGHSGGAAVQLLGQLRRAIDRSELAVVYQPQIDLSTRAVVGVEALVRWPHPHLGVLEPDRFLPLVRHHGLMPAVTDVVVRKALDDLASWHAQGCAVPLAVNLFAPSLGDLELPLSMAWGLAERQLPARLLTIEITEDLILDNLHRTRTVLDELRSRGITISIDDFGSGYSAFSYLRELPFDEMKICRQLVGPIAGDVRAEAVVRAVVELAHILGARVVAEGVEDQATDLRLQQLGCDVGQGFHYFRPLGYEATTALLCEQMRRRFDTPHFG